MEDHEDLLSAYSSNSTGGGGLMDLYSTQSTSSDNLTSLIDAETPLIDSYKNIESDSLLESYSESSVMGADTDGVGSDFTRNTFVAGENESAGLLGAYQGLNAAIKQHLRNDMSRGDGQNMDTAIADMVFDDKDSPIDEIIGRRIGVNDRTKAGIFARQNYGIVATAKLMDKTGVGKGGTSDFAKGTEGNSIDNIGDDWMDQDSLSGFGQADWTNAADPFADPWDEEGSGEKKEEKTEYSAFTEKGGAGRTTEDVLSGKGKSNPFADLGPKVGGRSVNEVLTGVTSSKETRKYDNASVLAKEAEDSERVEDTESGDPSEVGDGWDTKGDSWGETNESQDQNVSSEIFKPIEVMAGLGLAAKLASQKTVSEKLSEQFDESKEVLGGAGVAENLAKELQKNKFKSEVKGADGQAAKYTDEELIRRSKEEKAQFDIKSLAVSGNCSSGQVGCDEQSNDKIHQDQSEIARASTQSARRVDDKYKKIEDRLNALDDETLEMQRLNIMSIDSDNAKIILHTILSVQQSRKIKYELEERAKKQKLLDEQR